MSALDDFVTHDGLAKLRAAIVYACGKQESNGPQLNNITLNKVLWYSDTAAYLASGKSITDSRYIRKPRGPVAQYTPAALDQLARTKVIASGTQFDATSGKWLKSYTVIDMDTHADDDGYEDDDRDAELERVELSSVEKAFLDRAFKSVCQESDAEKISEKTHGEVWNLAVDGEEIPLHAIYAERLGKITQTHIKDAFS